MIFTRNNIGIFCLAILLGFGAQARPAGAQPISHLNLDSRRVPWTALSFYAKNFWIEVSTDIQIKSRRAYDLDGVLPASPKGVPIKPQAPLVNEMTINTTIDPRFREPVKMHNRIWFDPTDASALGRIRLRRGEDDFKKTYRFTDQGVFRHRIEPRNREEASLQPDKWTDIKDTFYPYDINRLNCATVSERSVLIYILSAAAVSSDDTPLTLCIFGKRQLHRVQLRKEGIWPVKINYIEKNRQIETRKEGTVNALKFTITARPEESRKEEAENFSFLGFHKDITIYVEPTSGLPIRADGIIPTIGKTRLNLREVRFKKGFN